VSPRFDTIPPRSDPEYVRPPDDAYEVDEDTTYRRHQAVNNLITNELTDRITGAGTDQETVYGIDPQEQFFAGVVASQYPYREAQAEDDSFQNIATKVAPFKIGLKFRVDTDIDDDAVIDVEPDAKVFYRRFPTYEEQLEHGQLAGTGDNNNIQESGSDRTVTDGGTEAAETDHYEGTQSLVGVYERYSPEFPSIELTGSEIREAATSGETITRGCLR